LSLSGFDTAVFTFAGFLPVKAGARDLRLAELLARPETVVLYEAPHRARATLGAIARLAPERRVAACRELTKLHEEVRRGTASEVLDGLTEEQERGEWALVLEGAPAARPEEADDDAARKKFVAALVETGVAEEDAERRATFVLGPKARRRKKA
jgi:16S rRNA (cytidine1402-2'-O)-methyltransferase